MIAAQAKHVGHALTEERRDAYIRTP